MKSVAKSSASVLQTQLAAALARASPTAPMGLTPPSGFLRAMRRASPMKSKME